MQSVCKNVIKNLLQDAYLDVDKKLAYLIVI